MDENGNKQFVVAYRCNRTSAYTLEHITGWSVEVTGHQSVMAHWKGALRGETRWQIPGMIMFVIPWDGGVTFTALLDAWEAGHNHGREPEAVLTRWVEYLSNDSLVSAYLQGFRQGLLLRPLMAMGEKDWANWTVAQEWVKKCTGVVL